MAQLLFFIVMALILLATGFLIGRRGLKKVSGMEKAWQARREHKENAKKKILELFGNQPFDSAQGEKKIHNDDVQKLLGVSHAMSTRYLEELEKEGKITQHGSIGKDVFYTAANDNYRL